MSEPHVLIVTSASADASAVVPVLAACEAAGMRVRAIDVGAAGAAGGGLSDRMRRALLGESTERRLRKEIDSNPPDVTIAFDPFSAQALSVARDQVGNPAPVVAVVSELEPRPAWGEADADRYCALDAETAVALADAGVDDDRILVVGPIGERGWADAAAEDRGDLRRRFGIAGKAVVVEVAGMGAELTGQLALQLSLAEVSEGVTYLFDAAGDDDAAQMLRRQVPVLGLRAKLFGQSADAPRYWRAADVVVGRPRPRTVARALLVGARLLALIDDDVPGAARIAAAIEARGKGAGARGILLLSSGLEAMLRSSASTPAPDGADHVVDVAWTVATERRAVIEERRAAARAETHARIRDATAAATAAARSVAMPGELEDLGGPASGPEPAVPDARDLAALTREAVERKQQLLREVEAARKSGEAGAMHKLLAELAELDRELKELETATAAARAAGARAGAAPSTPPPPRPSAGASTATGAPPRPRPAADPLADLRRKAAASNQRASASIDDELEALKRKMTDPSKKK